MKKVVLLILAFSMLILSSCAICGNTTDVWKFAEPLENVTALEIIDLDNDWVVLKELPPDHEVLLKLEGMHCKIKGMDPEFDKSGLALKVYYEDGTYELVGYDYNYHEYPDGRHYGGLERFDEEEFNDILRSYLDEEVSDSDEDIYNPDEPGVYEVSDEYTLSDSDAIDTGKYYALYYKNQEYTFRIFDSEGNIAKQGRCWREPNISEVNDSTVLFTLQMGTGLSTQWGFFYDCENNIRSDKFDCIYDHADSVFAYGAPKKVIVRSIFSDGYYREFTEFENPLADSVEPILYAEFSDNAKTITITYLTGEDYREVSQDFSL